MIITTIGSDYWPKTADGRILAFLLSVYAFSIFGYITAALASLLIGRDEKQIRRYITIANSPEEIQDKIRKGEATIAEVGDAGSRTRSDKKKMSVKSIKNGFSVNFKFNRIKNNIDKALEFVNKVAEMLKTEKQAKHQ